MILADTSIWIDHLHRPEEALRKHLVAGAIRTHPLVIHELALGSIRNREAFLESINELLRLPALTHSEFLEFVKRRALWGRGLSAVDVHLLGSVAITEGASLWTRDKRLRAAAEELGLGYLPDSSSRPAT